MLDPADVLVDRHPGVDRGALERRLGMGRAVAQEIPELSTKVSKVSVSLRRPPHRGHATCFQVGW